MKAPAYVSHRDEAVILCLVRFGVYGLVVAEPGPGVFGFASLADSKRLINPPQPITTRVKQRLSLPLPNSIKSSSTYTRFKPYFSTFRHRISTPMHVMVRNL